MDLQATLSTRKTLHRKLQSKVFLWEKESQLPPQPQNKSLLVSIFMQNAKFQFSHHKNVTSATKSNIWDIQFMLRLSIVTLCVTVSILYRSRYSFYVNCIFRYSVCFSPWCQVKHINLQMTKGKCNCFIITRCNASELKRVLIIWTFSWWQVTCKIKNWILQFSFSLIL